MQGWSTRNVRTDSGSPMCMHLTDVTDPSLDTRRGATTDCKSLFAHFCVWRTFNLRWSVQASSSLCTQNMCRFYSMKAGNLAIKQQHLQNITENEAALTTIMVNASRDTRWTIKRSHQDTSMWLSVSHTTVNGTELSAQEFWDILLVRYDKMPTDLPTHCDGCYKPFNLHHALECKKGGLIICYHIEIKDKLVVLATKRIHPLSSTSQITSLDIPIPQKWMHTLKRLPPYFRADHLHTTSQCWWISKIPNWDLHPLQQEILHDDMSDPKLMCQLQEGMISACLIHFNFDMTTVWNCAMPTLMNPL
jgi:hypothetical protein